MYFIFISWWYALISSKTKRSTDFLDRSILHDAMRGAERLKQYALFITTKNAEMYPFYRFSCGTWTILRVSIVEQAQKCTVIYEGVSTSFRNHPKVKEPDTSFLYLINKTSLKSYYAKLHIPPTFYWLSTDQNCYMGVWHWNS